MEDSNQHHLASVKIGDCPVTKVTVYKDKAEVGRHYEGTIQPGTTDLHLTDFVDILEDSIRVEGKGDATITEVTFQVTSGQKPENDEQKKITTAKIKRIEKTIKDLNFNSKMKILKRQWDLLGQFASTAASFGKNESAEAQLTENFCIGMNLFMTKHRSASERIEREMNELEARLEQLETAKAEAETELNKSAEETATLAKSKLRECIIVLEAVEEVKISLDVSYVVKKASWKPSYDLRMFTDKGTLKICYYGKVEQHSGEDWTNVKLLLSTAEPSVGGSIPILPQVHLSIAFPRPSRYVVRTKGIGFFGGSGGNDEGYDVAGSDSDSEAEMKTSDVRVREGRFVATYEVSRLTTIPSSETPHKVTVAMIETQPSLSYVVVLRMVAQAYLEAKVTNSSPFVLLPGPTSIFLDNQWVGKAELSAVAPKEEFKCSLGGDQGVRVDYRPATKKQSTHGVLSKVKVTQHEQIIEIKNTRDYDVQVTVKEALPLSMDERIKVTLLSPVVKTKTEKAASEEPTLTSDNHVVWKVSLKAMEKTEFVFRYTVERPYHKSIETTEHFSKDKDKEITNN